jgi:hypothetical protein
MASVKFQAKDIRSCITVYAGVRGDKKEESGTKTLLLKPGLNL